ncbi:phosphonoacetaldehyde hydrolase [Crateriforma conspicua]|uniref:phosphonoacetaldehyde hydrolase n=1 Tax=Crateriforma conspicua TaxID=2527996 RepID=UPI001187B54C|nr:phosphonoacetaldehyde hydrolase [Crateriforma conspicua]QDV64405.1 Phosphonoacetaldehyde hydrolase [Crateriforma conspicua]
MSNHLIKLVVFDWAGTTVDFGCFSPVQPFRLALAAEGIDVSIDEARLPMGLSKLDHLHAIFEMSNVRRQWREKFQREWTEDDVRRVYEDGFVPQQLQCAKDHSDLVPGLLQCIQRLRKRNIKIASTTGYFRDAAEIVFARAAEQGYEPDFCICGTDVPAGRPAPWMIFRAMEALNVCPPAAVLKIGDTVPDVLAGINAGAWSVGVTDTSSSMGLSQAEFEALSDAEKENRRDACAATLTDAGAHAVIPSIASLPELIERIEAGEFELQRPSSASELQVESF